MRAIATSFDDIRNLKPSLAAKVHLTGNPVRDSVIDWAARAYRPPVADQPIDLVVFGGSQGARFFSDTVPAALRLLPETMSAQLRVVQQARGEDVVRVETAYAEAGITAIVAPFFADLPQRMAEAQLVIARAGASTVAELTVLGRPAILVPLPHALDNDQLYNATRLAESGGGWCIEQKDLTAERMAADIAVLLGSPDRLNSAAIAAKKQDRPDAVVRLADHVEELIGVRGTRR